MYNELRKYQLVPDLNTMHAIIRQISKTSEQNDKKVEAMMEKLKEMHEYGITPTLQTFNIALELIASLGLYQRGIPLSLDILKEMQLLNIAPCLATYSSILNIFYPNRDIGSKTGVLGQVIDEVEKMASSEAGLEWRDSNDSNFFVTAMTKCYTGIGNLEYAKRLHSILMKDNNIRFLNDHYSYVKYL
jgi:hypothetical protein